MVRDTSGSAREVPWWSDNSYGESRSDSQNRCHVQAKFNDSDFDRGLSDDCTINDGARRTGAFNSQIASHANDAEVFLCLRQERKSRGVFARAKCAGEL